MVKSPSKTRIEWCMQLLSRVEQTFRSVPSQMNMSSVPPTVIRAHCSRRHLRGGHNRLEGVMPRALQLNWRLSIQARVPAATQVGLLVASALCLDVGRWGCHHQEIVRHTSVQRKRADRERLQRLVSLRNGYVVEPNIEGLAGLRVLLNNEPALQRCHRVDDCLEMYTLRVWAVSWVELANLSRLAERPYSSCAQRSGSLNAVAHAVARRARP